MATQVVYEAANSLDAHIVLNMLRAQGLDGCIDGEYLQGGMGELPVAGLVRVRVDDVDADAARASIRAWERGAQTTRHRAAAGRAGVPRELAILMAALLAMLVWKLIAGIA